MEFILDNQFIFSALDSVFHKISFLEFLILLNPFQELLFRFPTVVQTNAFISA